MGAPAGKRGVGVLQYNLSIIGWKITNLSTNGFSQFRRVGHVKVVEPLPTLEGGLAPAETPWHVRRDGLRGL